MGSKEINNIDQQTAFLIIEGEEKKSVLAEL